MVFEPRQGKTNNSRCKSADSGVSIALPGRHNIQISSDIGNDLEEDLDFEPDPEEEYDPFQNESQSKQSQYCNYGNQSTFKDINLCMSELEQCKYSSGCGKLARNSSNFPEEVDSSYSDTPDNSSVSNMSAGHRREMLPIPPSVAKDGRQYEYLPFYTPSVSFQTLDSSSEEENSMDSEMGSNSNLLQDGDRDTHSYLSGNENEDNSSEYSMTQEEEDKLLNTDSGGDESQDGSFLVETGEIKSCKIGNARITFPTFVSKDLPTNDLKRTKKSLASYDKKKKKKWDLRFKEEFLTPRVFLNDIGYIPEEEGDTKSSGECSGTSESSFGSLIVICDKDRITCTEPQCNNPRSTEKRGDSSFKLPLPPPKRPPTRAKRTVSSSSDCSGKSLQIEVSNKEVPPKQQSNPSIISRSYQENDVLDSDDSISIIASTLGDVDDIANVSSLKEDILFNTEQYTQDLFNTHQQETLHVDQRLQEWIQSVPNPEVHNAPPSYSLKDVTMGQTIAKEGFQISIPNVPPPSVRGNPQMNFRDIPSVFCGLCYPYYFLGNCEKPNCHLAHTVHRQKFVNKFEKCSPEDLLKAFKYSQGFAKLFIEVYPLFIIAFGRRKMQNDLIGSITVLLKRYDIDSTEALDFIVNALEESGLTFLEAIEMISFNIGFFAHPELADILLDLITRKYNISENWNVIKRIAKARGKVKPSIVERMLHRLTSVYPPNKDLCLEIYNLIIKGGMTDLSGIKKTTLVPYHTLCSFQDGLRLTNTNHVQTADPKVYPRPFANQDFLTHVDHNWILERERFERQIEAATEQASNIPSQLPSPEVSYPTQNYETQQTSPLRSGSQSLSSEDQYFVPVSKPSIFSQDDLSQATCNNYESTQNAPSSSHSDCNVDNENLNVALRFEPPPSSEISEYIPQNVTVNDIKNQQQEIEVNLTPSRPIFGSACYRDDFNIEKCLHNLLPDSFDNVSINEKDVKRLNFVINMSNGQEFYDLLKYYKKPPTLMNFITMTIAHLISSRNGIYNTLMALMTSIGSVKPDYTKDKLLKPVIEVIVMNLLFQLEKKGLWNEAKNLLELFCDWDSLVSSKLFQIFSLRSVTHMGRYIFLAKIFTKAKNFHFAYEILQCPNLKLLEAPETWPYFYNYQVDLECRNTVLKEFFQYGYRHYIVGVSDMYRRIYKFEKIYGFDAQVHFNPMLIALINEQERPLLKYFHDDIDIYYNVMDKHVLRALMVLLADQLTQTQLFHLYELCCSKQIYTLYMGNETTLTMRNHMFNVELQFILNYYFYKLSENRRLPPGNVTIQIKLLDSKPVYPKMLHKCIRSIKEINGEVKKILKDHLSIAVLEKESDQLTMIEIAHEQIAKWLLRNQRWFPVM